MAIALACLTSCSAVQEARGVVASADSLWEEGVRYDDSATIAKAAATLRHIRFVFPTDYAHANYYYGCILRDRAHHAQAMQAYLRVVHSRTKDHACKGNAYSNMASICRLANERDLACEIYLKSAEEFLAAESEFLLAEDTVAYYHALNNIVVDLMEVHNCIQSIALTDKPQERCTQEDLVDAIHLLRQQLHQVSDILLLWLVIVVFATIGVVLIALIVKRKRQHRVIKQQLERAQKENSVLSNLHKQNAQRKEIALNEIQSYCNSLNNSQNLKEELSWNNYDALCDIINRRMYGLAEKLKVLGSLNEREIRLCILVLIGNLRDKEMADILCYSNKSIRSIKRIVAKKLGTTSRNLRAEILDIAVY